MATDPKTIEQEYHYQVDQQVSVNSFIDIDVEGENVRFQVTSRYGSTPEKIIKTTMANIEAFIALRQQFPRNLVKPTISEPKYQPIDDGGHEQPEVKSFIAEKLSVSMKDGKFYFKVIGKPFTQYGVTVWDEVLQAAGITVDMSNPNNLPNIEGWKAEYIEKPGNNGKMNPHKVTRLLPSKAPF